jgi:hypothetical protein
VETDDIDWLIDLEISLVKLFHWSLYEIDETSIESLLPFVYRLTNSTKKKQSRTYCDEVEFL